MARPLYPHELGDPDFAWLINNFQEQNPHFVLVDHRLAPVILIDNNGPDLGSVDTKTAMLLTDAASNQTGEVGSGDKK